MKFSHERANRELMEKLVGTPELTKDIQEMFALQREEKRLYAFHLRTARKEREQTEKECELLLDKIRTICPEGTSEAQILLLFKALWTKYVIQAGGSEAADGSDIPDGTGGYNREWLRDIGEI